jgi:hypothetical protein
MFSEIFFTSLYTSLIGFLIAIGAQCYKSKCKEVKICCIKITRDIQIEEELDQRQPPNPIQSQSNL